jgi:hypothetical protein
VYGVAATTVEVVAVVVVAAAVGDGEMTIAIAAVEEDAVEVDRLVDAEVAAAETDPQHVTLRLSMPNSKSTTAAARNGLMQLRPRKRLTVVGQAKTSRRRHTTQPLRKYTRLIVVLEY